MKEKAVLLERMDDVARITLQRPESFNAYDFALAEALQEAMDACGRDAGIRAVIFTGSGTAFCSGGDIRAMDEFVKRGEVPPSVFFQRLTLHLHPTVVEMRRMPKPILGAINGVAAGAGFSLALACDLRVAADTARFTQAYTRLGVVPDGGSTYLLPRLVGPGRAAELILLNPVLSAQEALQWGLVNRVVPEKELEGACLEMARGLARGPTQAFARAKALLDSAWDLPLEAQLEEERRGMMASSLTEDFREGMAAFLDKRSAQFKGR
jgi:2-(1,2-epoxy-1,2-dihydrophenyl)acetyl-CoA isomerase